LELKELKADLVSDSGCYSCSFSKLLNFSEAWFIVHETGYNLDYFTWLFEDEIVSINVNKTL
jgi:hypothetical protein